MNYVEMLDKKLTDFAENFGIESVNLGEDFCYSPASETITYTIYWQDNDDEFISLVDEKYNADIHDWFFIFSLLHEIGHHETWDELTQEDLDNDLLLRNAIAFFDNQGLAYINLKAEHLATSWALDFIENNSEEVWKFQSECWEIIQKIYEEKGLTD